MPSMPVQSAFARLVLGDPDAAAAGEPAPERVDAVAAAWRACAPELARRRSSLSWSAPAAPGREAPVTARLTGLPDLERGAVVAQALGLEPAEVERALDAEAGAAPGLLARAHAGLAGLGLPADRACGEERERVAGEGGASTHCADCEAFTAAAREQRRALRKAGRRAERDAEEGERTAAEAARGLGPAARRLDRLVEPRGVLARTAVALAVLLVSGAAGFGLVRAYEAPGRGDSIGEDGVVTATPVGPLPPGVGPTTP